MFTFYGTRKHACMLRRYLNRSCRSASKFGNILKNNKVILFFYSWNKKSILLRFLKKYSYLVQFMLELGSFWNLRNALSTEIYILSKLPIGYRCSNTSMSPHHPHYDCDAGRHSRVLLKLRRWKSGQRVSSSSHARNWVALKRGEWHAAYLCQCFVFVSKRWMWHEPRMAALINYFKVIVVLFEFCARFDFYGIGKIWKILRSRCK